MNSPRFNFMAGRVDIGAKVRTDTADYACSLYWLPADAGIAVARLMTYFCALIDADSVSAPWARYDHHYVAVDTAVEVLARICRRIDANMTFLAGNSDVSPIAWARFGNGNMGPLAKLEFPTVESIFAHYCDPYEADLSGMFGPAAILQTASGVHILKVLIAKSRRPVTHAMLTAVMLLQDLLVYAGPETEELADLYNNDACRPPASPDVLVWLKARASLKNSAGGSLQILHRPPPPRPRIVIEIVEWSGALEAETSWTTFHSIDPNPKKEAFHG